MKWKKIFRKGINNNNNPQNISTTKFCIMLAVILSSLNSTASDEHRDRNSIANYESIKNGNRNENLNTVKNDSKNLNPNLNLAPDLSPSLIKNIANSQALNTFLKNILIAKDELKWIDENVRNKIINSKETNYEERSAAVEDRQPFDDQKSKSYLARDGEIEISNRFIQPEEKSRFNKFNPIRTDRFSTRDRDKIISSNKIDDFSKDVNRRVANDNYDDNNNNNRRNQRDTIDNRLNFDEKPTDLESLKKTILELRKSLENRDKEVSHYSDGNENEKRNLGGSDWWEDPRSASSIFDFKKRNNDFADENDSEENYDSDFDSSFANSEFDFISRRVETEKEKEKNHDNGADNKIRVYRRAGFGESYREHEKDINNKEKNNNYKIHTEIRDATNIIGEYRHLNATGNGDESKNYYLEYPYENKNGHFKSPEMRIKNIHEIDDDDNNNNNNNDATNAIFDKAETENEPGKKKASETAEKDRNESEKKKRSSAFSFSKGNQDENLKPEVIKSGENDILKIVKIPGDIEGKIMEVDKSETGDENLNKISQDLGSNDKKVENGEEGIKAMENIDGEAKMKIDKSDVKILENEKKIGETNENNFDTGIRNSSSKIGESVSRKLLWLSEKWGNGDNKIIEIENGKRDKNNLKNGEGDPRSSRPDKRSLKSYEENYEEENDDGYSDSKKFYKSIKNPGESENAYEIEEDNEEPKRNVGGSDKRAPSSRDEKDRDPMRDRINMLIKEKLDDRIGKGGLTHVDKKRDVMAAVPSYGNIQYYDYDSDSDQDLNSVENDPKILEERHDNETFPQIAIDTAPPETITKHNEEAEAEREEELENEKTKPEKEEFISDVELAKIQTKKPPLNGAEEEGRDDDSPRDNENRDRLAKSNNHWLGEPVEKDDGKGDQDSKESGENEKQSDNENPEILEEPLEYSVNVRGKLNPESVDVAIDEEKSNAKEKDDDNNNNNNNNKSNANDSEKLETGDNDHFKFQQLGEKSKSRFANNDFQREQSNARTNWRYKDFARIEEGINEEDVPSSQEANLIEESFDRDSLPTMIDRSGSVNLVEKLSPGGERTYLVIAPRKHKEYYNNEYEKDKKSDEKSRKNYLALKITDDMFKGGIEQSNPIENKDDINDNDNYFMGKTSTEWKVIKMGENSGEKIKSKLDNNYYDDNSRSLRNLIHESIVDAEEMVGDIDDDGKQKFGRDLKSIDDPNPRFGRNLKSIDHEKTSDKYLIDKQIGFENCEDDSKKEKKEAEKKFDLSSKNESSSFVNFEKRTLDFGDVSNPAEGNGNDFHKDKRGPTNVEEWENNSPRFQKQGIIIIPRNPNTSEKLSGNRKDEISPSSHGREIRSVDFSDEDFDPPGSKKRAKNVRRIKFHGSKLSPRFEKPSKYNSDFSPLKFHSRNNFDLLNERRVDNLMANYNNDKKLKDSERGKNNHRRHRHQTKKEKHFRTGEYFGEENQSNPDFQRRRQKLSRKGEGGKEKRKNELSTKSQKNKADKNRGKIKAGSISRSNSQLRSRNIENGGKYDSENGGDKIKSNENDGEDFPATSKPGINDNSKKKITVLLAVDNMEDESQMDLALHGELAGKIVERIFDQVEKTDALKVSLGPGLFRKHKSEDAIASDKIYRQGLDEDEVKHTEGMMRRVMELLGRLILDEVQRKTCASLPPDMIQFLQWILGVEEEDNRGVDQAPPLPPVRNQEPQNRRDDEFLFGNNNSTGNEKSDVNELNKKISLLRGLINEYNSLSDKEKIKVQAVHDYLARQLDLLLKYIEVEESGGGRIVENGEIGHGNILQYQNAVPNSNGTIIRDSTLSPLVNTPSILMLSNASFVDHPASHSRLRGIRSSSKREEEENLSGKKNEKIRKPKKKRKKKHRNRNNNRKKKKKKKAKKKNGKKLNKIEQQSSEYKKLIRKAATLRKKRANIYDDDWNPLDSGYEKAKIYIFNDENNWEIKRNAIDNIEPLINNKNESGVASDLNNRKEGLNSNEEQLEEVAFGKDMRGGWKEKEEFERLTKIDKRKYSTEDNDSRRRKREGGEIRAKEKSENFEPPKNSEGGEEGKSERSELIDLFKIGENRDDERKKKEKKGYGSI